MNRFDYIKYDEKSVETQKALKEVFTLIERNIDLELKDSRAKLLALTKLEESYMWCGKAIRDDQLIRNGQIELQEERNNI